jgi:hypothetical protein
MIVGIKSKISQEVKMDKDKKKIAIGAGIVGGAAGLVYLLTRKKPAATPVCTPGNTKCIGSDLCVCNAQGQWAVSVKDSPTCVPTQDTAALYGQVTDAQSGAAIEGIQISCNGYSGTTGADGRYRIENISPGDYTITFTDPLGKYETLTL